MAASSVTQAVKTSLRQAQSPVSGVSMRPWGVRRAHRDTQGWRLQSLSLRLQSKLFNLQHECLILESSAREQNNYVVQVEKKRRVINNPSYDTVKLKLSLHYTRQLLHRHENHIGQGLCSHTRTVIYFRAISVTGRACTVPILKVERHRQNRFLYHSTWQYCEQVFYYTIYRIALHVRCTQRRFPPRDIENTFQTIQSIFRSLEMHSQRSYKICICSVILREVESFRNYQGFSFILPKFQM